MEAPNPKPGVLIKPPGGQRVRLVAAIVGAACIFAGVFQVHRPAALVAIGILAIAAAIYGGKGRKR